MTKRAVILAAGFGSRLTDGGPIPKPLVEVGGEPLLSRILKTLGSEGIEEAVIVVGHRKEVIESEVSTWSHLDLDVEFVENDEYDLSNGVSLVKAAPYIDEHCILSMSDHLYSPELVRAVLDRPVRPEESVLGVDYKIADVFDIDDATKVRVNGPRIADIGKTLSSYDAIDTGVFHISPKLVEILTGLYETKGDCSLSDGVKTLAAEGNMGHADVGEAFWVDVDTPLAQRYAEVMLRLLGDDLQGLPAPAVASMGARVLALASAAW